MNISVAKTKEMLIINKEPPPNIFICSNADYLYTS